MQQNLQDEQDYLLNVLSLSKISSIFANDFDKRKDMMIISSNDFITNHEKYFNLALNEQEVYIKNGENMFMVSIANDRTRKYKQPDDDLRRAITMDELRERTHKMIEKFFANKNADQ